MKLIAVGANVHQNFPQKFVQNFEQANINIHDPRMTSLIELKLHSDITHTQKLNKQWEKIFDKYKKLGVSPSREQIIEEGRNLANEMGVPTNQIHF